MQKEVLAHNLNRLTVFAEYRQRTLENLLGSAE